MPGQWPGRSDFKLTSTALHCDQWQAEWLHWRALAIAT